MATLSADFLAGLERTNGLPTGILTGQMKQESGGKTRAVSKAGAMGLFQLMPATARELGVSDPFDEVQNAKGGAKYLAQQIKAFGGDVEKGLQAYNWGAGNMRSYLKTGTGAKGQPMPRETQEYPGKVLNKVSTGRDLSSELYGDSPKKTAATGRDLSAELYGDAPKVQKKTYQEEPNALVRFGAGMNDALGGIKQGALYLADKVDDGQRYAEYTKQQNVSNQTYQEGRDANGQTGFDPMRLVGNIAAAAPTMLVGGQALGGAKLLSKAGAKFLGVNAGIGSGIGAAQYAGDQSQRLQNVGIGALGGAAGGVIAEKIIAPVAGKVISSAARRNPAYQAELNANASKLVDDALNRSGIAQDAITPEIKASLITQVAATAKKGQTVPDEAIGRKAVLDSLGLHGTKGQLSGKGIDWQSERELAKIDGAGDNLRRKFAKDSEDLAGLLEKQSIKTEGKTNNPPEAMDLVFNALRSNDAEKSKIVGDLFKTARAATGNDLQLNGLRFVDQASRGLDDQGLGTFLPANVRKIMQDIFDAKGTLTLAKKEELVKILNNHYKDSKNALGQSTSATSAIGTVRSALENEVNQTLDDFGGVLLGSGKSDAIQAYTAARKAASDRFGGIERNPALQKALQDAAPDKAFASLVLGGNKRDIQAMVNELANHPEAIAGVKKEVIDHIARQSVGTNGQFNPRAMKNALDTISDRRLSVLFSPEDLAKLRNIESAAKYMITQPRESYVNNSNTASALANHMRSGLVGLGKNPILGTVANMTTNLAQRIGNASKSRDALSGRLPTTAGQRVPTRIEEELMNRFGVYIDTSGRIVRVSGATAGNNQ